MAAGEATNPPHEHHEPFDGYMTFAKTFGVQPDDSSELPEARERVLDGDNIPAVALAEGIDKLTIKYEPQHFDRDEAVLNPERVTILMHHSVGFTKDIWASRENGAISFSLDAYLDNEEEANQATPLSNHEQGEITEGVLNGELFWTELDTPAGDHARRVDLRIDTSRIEQDDIDLLRAIISELTS